LIDEVDEGGSVGRRFDNRGASGIYVTDEFGQLVSVLEAASDLGAEEDELDSGCLGCFDRLCAKALFFKFIQSLRRMTLGQLRPARCPGGLTDR
jgi:hypothetical protein